jgi:hypothetical protein
MKPLFAMVSLCVGLTASVFATDFEVSGFLSANFLIEAMLPHSSALVGVHQQNQRCWTPILPPGTTTFTMSEGILAFDEVGFKDAWFRNLVATDEGGYRKYTFTLAEDPITHNLIVRSTKGVKVGSIQAPTDYDPTWLAKTIYPDLSSGRYSPERVTAILAQYDPSRLVVQYSLLPMTDVDTYVAIMDALAPEQTGAMMTMLGMDPPEFVDEIIVGMGECDTTSAVVNVYVPAGFTNHLDIFMSTNGVGPRWSLATEGLLPIDGVVVWTNFHPAVTDFDGGGGGGGGGIPPPGGGGGSSSSNSCPVETQFFAAGNGDVIPELTDPDGDGLTTAREKFLWLSDAYQADTDDDGVNDGVEVSAHTDPTNPDTGKPIVSFISPVSGFRNVVVP